MTRTEMYFGQNQNLVKQCFLSLVPVAGKKSFMYKLTTSLPPESGAAAESGKNL